MPGNPLRSYRMSMLAHGFVDTPDEDTFELDDTDPVTSSVVRLRGSPLPAAAYLAIAAVILVIIGVIIFAI